MTYRLLGRFMVGCAVLGFVGCKADSESDSAPAAGDTDNAAKSSAQGGGSTLNIPATSTGSTTSGVAYGVGGTTSTGTTLATATSRGGAATVSPASGGAATAAAGGTTSDAVAGAAGASEPVDQCALLDATKPQTLYLSSDDSNSMASPVIARSIINQGGVPPANIIRTYEFLNYYDLGYERAAAGQLAINLEMAKGDAVGTYTLQIGVSSEAAVFVRRPMNITFVLDTSGSMGGVPIQRSQAAVKAVAASLRQGDIVSAVTWSDTNTIVVDSHIVAGPSDAAIVAMADAMAANGSTNLNAGLTVGYALAQKNFVASTLNRVVLISDGQANTGVTDENIIAQGANLNDGDGVYLVGVGVGDGVNDTLMNAVTDKGRGISAWPASTTSRSRPTPKRSSHNTWPRTTPWCSTKYCGLAPRNASTSRTKWR